MAITDDSDIVLNTKRRFGGMLLGYEGANAVGIGPKPKRGSRAVRPAITVFVTRKLPLQLLTPLQRIPPTLPAYDLTGTPIFDLEVAIDVESGGPFTFMQKNVARKRPLIPGFSTSPLRNDLFGGGAGTIGAALIDLNSGLPAKRRQKSTTYLGDGYVVPERMTPRRTKFFLTCAHVVADVVPQNKQMIIQPGQRDGGVLPAIGNPDRFTLLPQFEFKLNDQTYGLSNVDAAAVKLKPKVGIKVDIQDIGPPAGLRIILPRDVTNKVQAQKSGRTTGLTKGTITSAFADVKIGIGRGALAFLLPAILLRDQIIVRGNAGAMIESGDSGALALDDARMAFGLCVGGDDGRNMIVTSLNIALFELNHPRLSSGTANRLFVLPTRN